MVEQHGDDHHAEAVNRRERPPQEACAILVFAEQHEMVDGLDHQTEHTTDGEQPEQIEEIQRNIALAGQIAASHTLGSGVFVCATGIHTSQRELQTTLLTQRRIGGDMQGDQHDKLDSRADKVQAKPLQRQRQQAFGERKRNQQVRPLRDVPAFVPEKQHAEHRQARGGDHQHDRVNRRQNRGEAQRVERHIAGKHGLHDVQARQHDDRQRHHAFNKHDDAVNAND